MHPTAVIALLGLAVLTTPASALLIQAPTRAAITADTTVDWGTLGPEFTAVTPVTSFGIGSVGGASVFNVLTGSTHGSDFLPSNNLLALFSLDNFIGGGTGLVSGSFDIVFDTAVQAAGAQVQANLAGAFSGVISAYDSSNVLLGSYAITGGNNQNGDDSAVFAGVISTGLDIKRITFTGFGDGAAINALSVDTIADVTTTVPEPTMALSVLTALGLMAGVTRRRNNRR